MPRLMAGLKKVLDKYQLTAIAQATICDGVNWGNTYDIYQNGVLIGSLWKRQGIISSCPILTEESEMFDSLDDAVQFLLGGGYVYHLVSRCRKEPQWFRGWTTHHKQGKDALIKFMRSKVA